MISAGPTFEKRDLRLAEDGVVRRDGDVALIASSQPPPRQCPWTAATTGFSCPRA